MRVTGRPAYAVSFARPFLRELPGDTTVFALFLLVPKGYTTIHGHRVIPFLDSNEPAVSSPNKSDSDSEVHL
jgi:hypothetical protein